MLLVEPIYTITTMPSLNILHNSLHIIINFSMHCTVLHYALIFSTHHTIIHYALLFSTHRTIIFIMEQRDNCPIYPNGYITSPPVATIIGSFYKFDYDVILNNKFNVTFYLVLNRCSNSWWVALWKSSTINLGIFSSFWHFFKYIGVSFMQLVCYVSHCKVVSKRLSA